MWRGGTRKAVVVDYTKQPFRLYSQVLPQPTTWLLAKLQTLMLMHLLILWVRWCHLMVERTKTDSSLQAAAKLVLCPADEPPHALCSRSTCSFSAQGSPEQQAREKGNDWRGKLPWNVILGHYKSQRMLLPEIIAGRALQYMHIIITIELLRVYVETIGTPGIAPSQRPHRDCFCRALDKAVQFWSPLCMLERFSKWCQWFKQLDLNFKPVFTIKG